MKKNNIDEIVLCLLKSKEPLTIYSIAKKTKLSTSSIYNCINYLTKRGVILSTKDKKYYLQPLFYEKTFWKELEDYLMPLFNLINDYVVGEPDLVTLLFIITSIMEKNKEEGD